MGFSLLGSMGSQILARNYHQGRSKFQSFSGRGTHNINFKSSEVRSRSAKISFSKSEAIEFEERTSPDEVNSISKIYADCGNLF